MNKAAVHDSGRGSKGIRRLRLSSEQAPSSAAVAVDEELLGMLQELDVEELASALAAEGLTSVPRLQRTLAKLTADELAETLRLNVYEKVQLTDLCAKLQPVRHPEVLIA